MRFRRFWRVLRRCPARAVEAYQSVLLYGMSHDGTAVAVVPVLVIRMLTTDNQRCTRKHQNFGCKVRGATWCYTKCGSRLTEARACTLLFSNVEGEVCLDFSSCTVLSNAAAADAAEKEKFPRVLAVAVPKSRRKYCRPRLPPSSLTP